MTQKGVICQKNRAESNSTPATSYAIFVAPHASKKLSANATHNGARATSSKQKQKEGGNKKSMLLKSLISHFIGSLLHVLSWRKWRKWVFMACPCRVIRSSG